MLRGYEIEILFYAALRSRTESFAYLSHIYGKPRIIVAGFFGYIGAEILKQRFAYFDIFFGASPVAFSLHPEQPFYGYFGIAFRFKLYKQFFENRHKHAVLKARQIEIIAVVIVIFPKRGRIPVAVITRIAFRENRSRARRRFENNRFSAAVCVLRHFVEHFCHAYLKPYMVVAVTAAVLNGTEISEIPSRSAHMSFMRSAVIQHVFRGSIGHFVAVIVGIHTRTAGGVALPRYQIDIGRFSVRCGDLCPRFKKDDRRRGKRRHYRRDNANKYLLTTFHNVTSFLLRLYFIAFIHISTFGGKPFSLPPTPRAYGAWRKTTPSLSV